MRIALLSCSLLALVAAAPATQPATWTDSPLGRRVLRPFAAAPYPHPSRKTGFTAADKRYGPEFYWDSTVGLFVPRGYRAGDTVDYVVHFHGHKNHVTNVFERFALEEQIDKSGVNAILIVPQGPLDAPDSGGGKLELDENGFARLIDEVTTYLKAERVIHTDRVGHVALSAHSGGYKVTAGVLHRGGLGDRITDVALLDASYGGLDSFAEFAAAHADARIVSFHTKHLDAANEKLKAACTQASVPTREVAEADVSDATLAPRGGVTFVATTLPHDGVPSARDYLATVLRTSRLEKR